MSQRQSHRVDVLVIGGGTAGCAMAARLSEHTSRRVMLVEAGEDTLPGAVPADIANPFPLSYANPAYFSAAPPASGPAKPGSDGFSQPKIMGGGSSVMGMWALRGLPDDYNGWEAAGATGWGYDEVLTYFKRLERDLDFQGAMHGTTGPTPLMRVDPNIWPGFQRAVARAASARGLHFFPDIHAHHGDGVFALPNSTDGKTRASSAGCYLTPAVRARRNLEIRACTQALSLVFKDRKVTGAKLRQPDHGEELVEAGAVVVCCGAIHSPALLMRSGIGPANRLHESGIQPLLDLPGVGENLQNHVFVHLGGLLRPEARQTPSLRNYAIGCIRASSGLDGAGASDLFYGLISRTGARPHDNAIGLIAAGLYAPFSRGRVSLRQQAPFGFPHVDFQALSDPRDEVRLIQAAEFARALLHADGVRSTMLETFVMPRKLPVKRLNAPGLVAALGSAALAHLSSLPPALRRAAITASLGRQRLLSAGVPDRATFERVVLESAAPMFHPVGTCAIGSVVEPTTQVRGIDQLFVADASIMPRIPRANTNIPTLMVAERAAALIHDILLRAPSA